MAVSDTLRGYRTQFLYALYRVVADKRYDYTYVPEGIEDLDIFCGDKMIEAVQVKNLNHAVAYNDLKSKASLTSFFGRGCGFLQKYPDVKLRLVSFNGVSLKLKDNNKLASYLKSDPLVNRDQISALLNSFISENITEEYLLDVIIGELKSQYSAFNPNSEIKYLLQWIYTLAEARLSFTLTDLHNQILSFRKFQNAESIATNQLGIRVKRLFTDHEEFQYNVELLRDSFSKGISVSPNHILANLDVRREKWLEKIEHSFESFKTVVVHGASGQGKSALCYRYVFDYYSFAFEITNVLDHNIADITATLEEISAELRIPVLIYFDIKPDERAWVEIVRELSRHNNVHILISIREEDWNTTSNILDRIMEYGDIYLDLSEDEAKSIFIANCPSAPLSNFFDIWEMLGEDVPLLEYLYSIKHNTTLRSMLESQFNRLSPSQRKIVSQIVIPNYLGSSVPEESLFKLEDLDPIEVSSDLNYLIDEYFICNEGNFEDLHPIRTKILKDIITRDSQAILFNIGCRWIGKLTINNLDRYIINLFKNGIELDLFFHNIASLSSVDAKTCYSIVVALLWKSSCDYVENNEAIIDELRSLCGSIYPWFIPVNFTGIDLTDSMETIFKENKSLLEQCNNLKVSMWGQERLFDSLTQWLHYSQISISVKSKDEFVFLGKTLYLLSLGNLGDNIALSGLKPASRMEINSDELAILLLGLKSCRLMPEVWQELEEDFIRSARDLHKIYNLSVSTKSIEAIISTNFRDGYGDSNYNDKQKYSFINEKVLAVCEVFRMAFPDKEFYNCSIECGDITEIMIDTVKTISNINLPVRLMHIPRNMVCNLYAQKLKSTSKQSYYHQSIELRRAYVKCLSLLSNVLKNILEGRKITKDLILSYSKADQYLKSLPSLELPIGMHDPLSIENIHSEKNGIKDRYQNLRSYSNAVNVYSSNISSFINQAFNLICVKTDNFMPTKYLLFDSLVKLNDMKKQTLLLGNPYSPIEELERLCNKEEKTIVKLLEQWAYISNKHCQKISDAVVNSKMNIGVETLIKRCVKKLEIAAAHYHLSGQFSANNNRIKLKLEYDEFSKLSELDIIARNLLRFSFLPSEWMSAEQYLLESTFSNIEIEFYYKHIDGSLINISGVKYVIACKDLFPIAESDNWEFHLRKDPNVEIAVPEPIKRFDQVKGYLYSMVMIGSQTEKLSVIVNSDDAVGQNMCSQLKCSYKDIGNTIIATLSDCKRYIDSINVRTLSGLFKAFCDSIITLCEDGLWLESTTEARKLLKDMIDLELSIKEILVYHNFTADKSYDN